MTPTWHDKAHRIIAEFCLDSYNRTNRNRQGKLYKHRRPYSVPAEAEILIDCLNTDDEARAKAYFLELSFH
jgi:hypothetical protein